MSPEEELTWWRAATGLAVSVTLVCVVLLSIMVREARVQRTGREEIFRLYQKLRRDRLAKWELVFLISLVEKWLRIVEGKNISAGLIGRAGQLLNHLQGQYKAVDKDTLPKDSLLREFKTDEHVGVKEITEEMNTYEEEREKGKR